MTINPFNQSGKRALITGGTQVIGAAIAKALGYAGATVFINARNKETLEGFVTKFSAANQFF